MKAHLWIIGNYFSQDWNFIPQCFFKCTLRDDPDQKMMLDNYAIKVVGDLPAAYGYVKLEGEGSVDSPDTRIVLCADTAYELEFIYNRVADAFINHPGAIDLRTKGKSIRII